MENSVDLKLKFQAEAIADIWTQLCSLHTSLFELTCDEYLHLLASDMESLEAAIESKQNLIADIALLDDQRKLVALEIQDEWEGAETKSLSGLLVFLRGKQLNSEAMRIEKLNLVLMDIVDKIQAQNKKNQVFLNKAIISLKELKASFAGARKKYNTYGADGAARNGLGK